MKEISDIYLAAAFLSYGGKIEEVDRRQRRKVFHFSTDGISSIWVIEDGVVSEVSNPNADVLVTNYSADRLMLPPDYPFCLRDIKALIHDHERPGL